MKTICLAEKIGMNKLHFEKMTPEARKKFKDEYFSRPEYIDGKVPFEYKHTFSSGEVLEAFQDEEGIGHVIIQRDGKTIFDFSKFLPPDFLLVTPKYFQKFPKKKQLFDSIGEWEANFNRRLIFLGDFKSLKDILSLLHEIGHMENNTPEDTEDRRRLLVGSPDDDFSVLPRAVSSEKKLAKLHSKIEREAWAWAIFAIRKAERDTGIKLSEIFPKFSDLKKYINDCLGGYRRSHEWIIKEGHDEDFYKAMEKLFDRWKYSSAVENKKAA